VTAEDGVTVNYYKIVITVRTTSTDATLAYGYIKNESIPDIGTPASDISSVIAGSTIIASIHAAD
jgi:outer membrane receptor for monomeric catechols